PPRAPGALGYARRRGTARAHEGREPGVAAEGLRLRTTLPGRVQRGDRSTERPASHGARRDCPGDRGDPDGTGLDDHGGHGSGPLGGCAWSPRLGSPTGRAGLALAHRARRQSVVPDDAAVPPAYAG